MKLVNMIRRVIMGNPEEKEKDPVEGEVKPADKDVPTVEEMAPYVGSAATAGEQVEIEH
jgi:hypothetical protein